MSSGLSVVIMDGVGAIGLSSDRPPIPKHAVSMPTVLAHYVAAWTMCVRNALERAIPRSESGAELSAGVLRQRKWCHESPNIARPALLSRHYMEELGGAQLVSREYQFS